MNKCQRNFIKYVCSKLGHKRIEGEYEGYLLPYCERCNCDLPLKEKK